MSEVYEVLQHNRVKLQIVRFLMFFFLIEKLLKTTSWVFEDHVCLQLTLTLVTTVNAKKNAYWVRDEEPTFYIKATYANDWKVVADLVREMRCLQWWGAHWHSYVEIYSGIGQKEK